MEGSWAATAVGIVAGICSTVSFVPQVLKAWREGAGEAISKRMYMVTVTAFSLWIAYGFLIGSVPVVVFNSLSLVLSGTILVLKIREDRAHPRGGPSDRPPQPAE
ncbi:MAG TPA: SemiSWEET transporter [Alphaproteobacteria bacterium]|nr:SemiSWEET transporter [Alphaproteobacteria bacterium]